MRHSRAIHYLEVYDRNELSAQTRQTLESHLAGCDRCASHAEKISRMSAILDRYSSDPMPEGFEHAVENVRLRTLRAVRQTECGRTGFVSMVRNLTRPTVLISAGAAAACMLFLFVQGLQSGRHAERALGAANSSVASSAAAEPAGFRMVRNGSNVRIEWPRNGREHSIRMATDPVTVKTAGGQVVRGKSWRETGSMPAAGNVTYYLVD